MKRIRRYAPWGLAVLLLATPLAAETFRVKLKSGQVFETRYRPEPAGWDESRLVFLTEVGNKISLPRDSVAEVTVDTEVRGFGTVLNTTTIALGWAPNDALTPEQLAAGTGDPAAQLMRFLEGQEGQRPNYSVEQFVNVEEAGAGGLPAWDMTYNPPGSGAQGFVFPPSIQPRVPAAPAAAAAEGGEDN